MKITKLRVEKFRNIREGTVFEIGEKITLIAGQNATSKSSILGMLCQPFGLRKNAATKDGSSYRDLEENVIKTIDGKFFATKISKIFRVSSKYDNPQNGKYLYFVSCVEGREDRELIVQSEFRADQKK